MQLKIRLPQDNPEVISIGDNKSRKENFGASMYNVSPIEVFIENRS